MPIPEGLSHISTASFVGYGNIAEARLSGNSERFAGWNILQAARHRPLKPEIMLWPSTMNTAGAAELRKSLEKNGFSGPWAFHLPKYTGFRPENLIAGLFCLTKGDLRGFLFNTKAQDLAFPESPADYFYLLDRFAEVFPPKNVLVLTVHDFTIMERRKDYKLNLNPVGRRLAQMAAGGYPIGVELVCEGPFPSTGVPYVCYTEEFIRFCHQKGFGLTLDLHNLWGVVSRSEGVAENFPGYLRKFIDIAREMRVPIRMVHFNPFSFVYPGAHLSPAESSLSLGWIRGFLKEAGLENIPFSLETTRLKSGQPIQWEGLNTKVNQRTFERLLDTPNHFTN